MGGNGCDTSLGLLGRVQAGDGEAWQLFALECYEVVRRWCRWQRLNATDTDDVVQNAMMVVLRKVGEFRHSGKGSLRSWLRAIAWRCRCDALIRSNSHQYDEVRQNYEVAVDEIARLESQYEHLRRVALLQHAMLIVKQRVRPSTWNAFYRTAWLDEPVAVVAAQLDMPEYLIYSAKFRVQKLIQEEVRKLESREDACGAASDTTDGGDVPAFDRSVCNKSGGAITRVQD